MNIPINFDKIDETTFSIDGIDFRIEVDNTELGDIWVYECTSRRYPLCFDIDWQNETYDLIKCPPGEGRNGTVMATGVPLTKFLMKDMDVFINIFLRDTILTLIKHK